MSAKHKHLHLIRNHEPDKFIHYISLVLYLSCELVRHDCDSHVNIVSVWAVSWWNSYQEPSAGALNGSGIYNVHIVYVMSAQSTGESIHIGIDTCSQEESFANIVPPAINRHVYYVGIVKKNSAALSNEWIITGCLPDSHAASHPPNRKLFIWDWFS